MKEFDVTIVGLGPAGGTLANLLAMHDISILILDREKSSNGLFFGDSLIDYQVANKFSMDFIFVKAFSEWKNIPSDLKTISDFREINLA